MFEVFHCKITKHRNFETDSTNPLHLLLKFDAIFKIETSFHLNIKTHWRQLDDKTASILPVSNSVFLQLCTDIDSALVEANQCRFFRQKIRSLEFSAWRDRSGSGIGKKQNYPGAGGLTELSPAPGTSERSVGSVLPKRSGLSSRAKPSPAQLGLTSWAVISSQKFASQAAGHNLTSRRRVAFSAEMIKKKIEREKVKWSRNYALLWEYVYIDTSVWKNLYEYLVMLHKYICYQNPFKQA